MAICLLGALLTGCDSEPETGEIEVFLTLSRSGGAAGPTFDHAPQSGRPILAVAADGDELTGSTDSDGRAVLDAAPGTYEVTATGYPDGPQQVTVVAGETVTVHIDALAP
jgi:hypothetical protein